MNPAKAMLFCIRPLFIYVLYTEAISQTLAEKNKPPNARQSSLRPLMNLLRTRITA